MPTDINGLLRDNFYLILGLGIAYLTDDCCEKIEDSIGYDAAEHIYNDRD